MIKCQFFPEYLSQHQLWSKAKLKENSRGLFDFLKMGSFQQRNNLAKIFKAIEAAIAMNCDFEINIDAS